jgi:hypothetical protein
MGFRKMLTAGLLVLASFTTAFTAGTMSAAHATTVGQFTGSHSKLWWDGATCRQFAVYERTRDGAAFHSMVVASRRADAYLRVDVGLWAHDARSGAPRPVLKTDGSYVELDCAGSYGL